MVDSKSAGLDPADGATILSRAVNRAVMSLGVDSAAIVLASTDGAWEVVSATRLTATALLQQSYVLGEGPCDEVLRTCSAVCVPDVSWSPPARRWPLWSAEVEASGVRAYAAFPIRAGAIAAGVLVTFTAVPGRPHPADFPVAQRIADASFGGLLDLQAGLLDQGDGVATEPEIFNADVHLAAGMVMGQISGSITEALVRLRAHAFSVERPLAEVAAEVLARRLRFGSDLGGQRG